MEHAPPPWQLALARLEGALPFLSAEVADGLARASLRRLWRVHVRDFPQENQGPEHNPGVNGQRTLHPTPHANSPDRQNSLHRRYFLTPFNIRAAALDDGASLRP
jgi:hypothetical protein